MCVWRASTKEERDPYIIPLWNPKAHDKQCLKRSVNAVMNSTSMITISKACDGEGQRASCDSHFEICDHLLSSLKSFIEQQAFWDKRNLICYLYRTDHSWDILTQGAKTNAVILKALLCQRLGGGEKYWVRKKGKPFSWFFHWHMLIIYLDNYASLP